MKSYDLINYISNSFISVNHIFIKYNTKAVFFARQIERGELKKQNAVTKMFLFLQATTKQISYQNAILGIEMEDVFSDRKIDTQAY